MFKQSFTLCLSFTNNNRKDLGILFRTEFSRLEYSHSTTTGISCWIIGFKKEKCSKKIPTQGCFFVCGGNFPSFLLCLVKIGCEKKDKVRSLAVYLSKFDRAC